MHCGIYVRLSLVLLAVVAGLGVRPCLGQNGDADPAVKAEKKSLQRDPVAAAFAIPYGTVLNEKQQSEYQRLRQDKESDLRNAVAALDAATTPAEKIDLRQDVTALQSEIRAGMQQILAMPYNEALQARQQQAMQQAYGSSGQVVYSGSSYATAPGSYGYYYGPLYGYPRYGGWPVAYARRGPHYHGPVTPLVTQKATALAKAGASPAAQSTTAPATSKPSPAPAAKPQNQPAKRH